MNTNLLSKCAFYIEGNLAICEKVRIADGHAYGRKENSPSGYRATRKRLLTGAPRCIIPSPWMVVDFRARRTSHLANGRLITTDCQISALIATLGGGGRLSGQRAIIQIQRGAVVPMATCSGVLHNGSGITGGAYCTRLAHGSLYRIYFWPQVKGRFPTSVRIFCYRDIIGHFSRPRSSGFLFLSFCCKKKNLAVAQPRIL